MMPWSPQTNIQRWNGWLALCSAFITLTQAAVITENDLTKGYNISESFGTGYAVIAVIVCVVAPVVMLVWVVPACMDCMNSEVSSESHPACGESSHKWGGATGYTPSNTSGAGAGFRTGEVVHLPDQNQPLPYAMVPTQVPEQAGFAGYSAQGDGAGLTGYSSGPVMGQGGGGGAPTHYNPMDPDDPPPAYSAAASAPSY